MVFKQLAGVFSELERTSSRLAKISLLSQLFEEGKADISEIIYLSEGRVAPFFVNFEFNIGNALIEKAIARSSNISLDEVKKEYDEIGDLGDVVFNHAVSLDEDLTIRDVFATLETLVHTNGKDSTEKKTAILADLLIKLDKQSARYVIRIILGKLRLGFSDKTVLDALSVSIHKDKTKRAVIERAFYRCSDLGYIAKLLYEKGIEGLEHISLIPSVPVFAKLVERSSSVEEIMKRITDPVFQPKYDGMRAQIHLFMDEAGQKHVKIFSRGLEDLTDMFPDLVREVVMMKADSLILDSEVIGFNSVTEEFFPFQETMHRKRKYNVTETSDKIPIRSFVFDLLYINGMDITDEYLDIRLAKLEKLLKENNTKILCMSDSPIMHSLEEGEKYFMKCIEEGLEGIIAKDRIKAYLPGTRNYDWIKLKRASVSELNDTIDTVILGYYFGYGQRSKFGIGALLVGIYNPQEDRYETIAKIGTGLSDEMLQRLKKELDEIKVGQMESNVIVDKKLIPDVIVDPSIVIEVRADEITKSLNHTAGRNGGLTGYALRFPRLVRIRDDKRADEITTVEEIGKIAKPHA